MGHGGLFGTELGNWHGCYSRMEDQLGRTRFRVSRGHGASTY